MKLTNTGLYAVLRPVLSLFLHFKALHTSRQHAWDIKWKLNRYDHGDNKSFIEQCIARLDWAAKQSVADAITFVRGCVKRIRTSSQRQSEY